MHRYKLIAILVLIPLLLVAVVYVRLPKNICAIPPSNAQASEKPTVDELIPQCQNMSWNGDGYVRTIDIGGDKTDNKIVATLVTLSELEELNLHGARISEQSLIKLKQLKKLTSISLAYTPLNDATSVHLRDFTSLKCLDASHTRLSDASIENIASMSNLTRLFIRSTKITEQGAAKLKELMPNCIVSYKD